MALFSFSIHAQNSIPKSTLNELTIECMKDRMNMNIIHGYITIKSDEWRKFLLCPLEVSKYFDIYIDTLSINNKNYNFLQSNSKAISALFNNSEYASTRNMRFLNFNSNFPLTYFKYKDDKDCIFFINGASIDLVDSKSTNEKERARNIIVSLLIPWLRENAGYFKSSSIKYMGISVTYGCSDKGKDELSDFINFFDYETITMISKIDSLIQFENGEISDEKLVEQSDIFISDSKRSSDLSKIEIRL